MVFKNALFVTESVVVKQVYAMRNFKIDDARWLSGSSLKFINKNNDLETEFVRHLNPKNVST